MAAAAPQQFEHAAIGHPAGAHRALAGRTGCGLCGVESLDAVTRVDGRVVARGRPVPAAAVARAQREHLVVARAFNAVIEAQTGKTVDEPVLLAALGGMRATTAIAPGSMQQMVHAADLAGYLGGPVSPGALVPRPGCPPNAHFFAPRSLHCPHVSASLRSDHEGGPSDHDALERVITIPGRSDHDAWNAHP